MTKSYEGFGTRMTLQEWAKDERCAVNYSTLYSRVVNQELPIEEALTKPINRGPIVIFGETKTRHQWADDPRCEVTYAAFCRHLRDGVSPRGALKRRNKIMVIAFGEEKSLSEWTKDNRCSVSAETLRQRIKKGATPEKAIVTPLRKKRDPQKVSGSLAGDPVLFTINEPIRKKDPAEIPRVTIFKKGGKIDSVYVSGDIEIIERDITPPKGSKVI